MCFESHILKIWSSQKKILFKYKHVWNPFPCTLHSIITTNHFLNISYHWNRRERKLDSYKITLFLLCNWSKIFLSLVLSAFLKLEGDSEFHSLKMWHHDLFFLRIVLFFSLILFRSQKWSRAVKNETSLYFYFSYRIHRKKKILYLSKNLTSIFEESLRFRLLWAPKVCFLEFCFSGKYIITQKRLWARWMEFGFTFNSLKR